METQEARWKKYYGDLAILVTAPKWYCPKNRSKKQDTYSGKIVEGKHKDLSDFFFEDVKKVFDSLSERPSLIAVVPASNLDSFSPTIRELGKKLSEYAHIPNENIIGLKTPGKKRTKCTSAEERYAATKDALTLTRRVNSNEIIVLLLDDTKATGITLLECKKLLIEAGAKDVIAICLGINAPREK